MTRNSTETLFRVWTDLPLTREASYLCSCGLEELRKVKATYSLIIVPDSIRHICRHFLCTLKLKQNIVLCDSASEGDKMDFLALPREFLNRILREHKWPFFSLLSNRAFLLTGITEAIICNTRENPSGITLGIIIIWKYMLW